MNHAYKVGYASLSESEARLMQEIISKCMLYWWK